MSEFLVRPAEKSDIDSWEEMRGVLWPGYPRHRHDLENYFCKASTHRIAFIVTSTNAVKAPLGFIEISIGQNLESADSNPTAYIEGWYVAPLIRHAGAGKALIQAAETWAREKGCSALTSECDIENQVSSSAHQACGFREIRRSISFRKEL